MTAPQKNKAEQKEAMKAALAVKDGASEQTTTEPTPETLSLDAAMKDVIVAPTIDGKDLDLNHCRWNTLSEILVRRAKGTMSGENSLWEDVETLNAEGFFYAVKLFEGIASRPNPKSSKGNQEQNVKNESGQLDKGAVADKRFASILRAVGFEVQVRK